jgi:hypothetical protein
MHVSMSIVEGIQSAYLYTSELCCHSLKPERLVVFKNSTVAATAAPREWLDGPDLLLLDLDGHTSGPIRCVDSCCCQDHESPEIEVLASP